MEITGFDTNCFLFDSSFGEQIVRFIEAQCERWPSLYFNCAPVAESFGPEWCLEVNPGAEYADHLTFSSGPEMENFWEENGYALDSNGEGPFAVFYSFHPSGITARLRDVEVEGGAEGGEFAARLEGSELMLPEFFVASLVLPGDPAQDAFSLGVLADFRRVFGRQGG
ncbi:hypothetical protein E6W39_17830 [Kitasatospora acidiphila]|uniref:Uncharacterized protein n=1 Tax=Kitasatospora acidiphila TaxID=2567942 RepID=A0A540W442_9ACTN|nr:hypothetical protein [Kitasatospora acidiphila]TQF03752.1 hypothetical protein E6W39_17830 [Kitasatospora acidiphila]